ncbi:MAG: integrin alpha [Isosphaeraceae bacterium]|nr:integrin alpha [Isosphaeraceae bacterium]
MLFRKGRPRPSAERQQPRYRPRFQYLEPRELLAGAPALDLGGQTSPKSYPASAVSQTVNGNFTTGPFGIDMGAAQSNGGAGWSVTDVGDMNGDGFDDYVVGAPTITNSGGLNIGSGRNTRAYLIFGSNAVNQTTVQNWLNLTQLEATNGVPNGTYHVGDLQQLGNTQFTQNNPISGIQGFPFNGVTFMTNGLLADRLGASVAVVPGGVNGSPAFLIGSPGADALGDPSNTAFPNYGRAYLVIGGTYLNSLTPQPIVNFDNPASSPVKFVTFGASVGAGPMQLGSSVAGLSNFFADGGNQSTLVFGAPAATFNGNSDAGVVFAIAQSGYAGAIGTTNPVNLATVGQNSGLPGVIFGGAAAGDFAGFSVANAGDVDGLLSGTNQPLPDLLIGAPGTINAGTGSANNGGGTAYLIYGRSSLLNPSTTNSGINNATLRSTALTTIGDPSVTTGDVLGAVFTGTAGDGTGYAVAGAGDVNNDGLADFLIGAPLANTNAGRASLIMGQSASTTVIKGPISLSTPPITVQIANFTGPSGSLAGYSVSGLGKVNADNFPEFLIGAPGYLSNQGAAYIVAGRSTLVGTIPLDTRDAILTTIDSSTSFGSAPTFYGASVGGRPFTPPQAATADQDTIPDPIVGAPGYAVTTGRSLDGGVFISEGAFIKPLVPTQLATTTQLNAPGTGTTTAVNANGPVLTFYVLGQLNVGGAAGNNFNAAANIDPTTLVLSSSLTNYIPVSLPANTTVTVTPITDPNNANITDAKITVTFAANAKNPLNLINGSQTLTLSGLLTQNALTNPVTQLTGGFTGSFQATVTNGSSGGGGGGGGGGAVSSGVGSAVPIGLVTLTFFQTPFGPDQFVPTSSALSAYNYKPIPKRVAYQQFQPDLGFKMRILNYEDPGKYHFQAARSASPNKHGSSLVLSSHTFNQSAYHPGKTVVANHKVPVIPTQDQHQKLTPRH